MNKKTLEERWTGAECTLDGEPARIVGRCLDFPLVRTRKHDVEFSWQAVDRVMREHNGEFKA